MKAALHTLLSPQPRLTQLRQSIGLLQIDPPPVEDEVVRAHAKRPTLKRDDNLLRTIGATFPATTACIGLRGTCTTGAKHHDFLRTGSAQLRHALRSARSLDAVRRSAAIS